LILDIPFESNLRISTFRCAHETTAFIHCLIDPESSKNN
jgi:hypothetical protein